MNQGASPSQAAVVLVLLLAWVVGASGRGRAEPCRNPGEVAAEAGWTTEVRCELNGPGSALSGLRGPVLLLFGQPLDLNEADAQALEVLPGIGPSRARAIVAARSEGPFGSLAELESIPGIGPVTVARLAGWAQVVPSFDRFPEEE